MRRIAVINQKGGVGKTTTCANLGAALAQLGRRVLVVDMDPQANLSLHLGQELFSQDPSTYTVLTGETPFEAAIRPTSTPGLSIVPAHIDLSGAELELASAIGRETLLRDGIDDWERAALARTGAAPVDYLILDCPPSLGLLSVNALAAAREVLIAVQTEFFALQGMSKLVEVVQLLRRRLNPELRIRGILPCLYDSRLRLAREVLAEVRRYFPGQVFQTSIRTNVKLAEAPSHGITIFEYDPQCTGATDHLALARELLAQEGRDASAPAPVESSPERAEELERRLSDMARGSRPQPSAPPVAAEPRREPAVDPEPEAGREAAAESPAEPAPTADPAPEESSTPAEAPEVHPVTFPSVDGALAREAIVLQPTGATHLVRGEEDLIVLSEPRNPEAPHSGPPEEEEAATLAPTEPVGADAGESPAPPPFEGHLEPICWQPKEDGSPFRTPVDAVAPAAVEGAPRETEDTQEAPTQASSAPPSESAERLEDAPGAPEPAPEALAEVDVPRPEDPPSPPSRWNFPGFYGEDRRLMAGKLGPRTP